MRDKRFQGHDTKKADLCGRPIPVIIAQNNIIVNVTVNG